MKYPIYDGFEERKLRSIWSHKKFEEGAVRIQSKIKRKERGLFKSV